MKRLLACAVAFALAAGAQAQDRGDQGGRPGGGQGGGMRTRGYANPSAAIAAEIAFARLAQEKGQWTAFRETAAADAVMFSPDMVLAHIWLKGRPDPAQTLTWQPHQVWSSCDGSMMVTTGAWQRGDKHGWFTTVWQAQEKGGYKWLFDHGDETAAAIETPDMIAAKVADCPERRPRPVGEARPGQQRGRGKQPKTPPVPFDPAQRRGQSRDGTLVWQVTADTAGAHDFSARMMIDGQMQEFRSEHVGR